MVLEATMIIIDNSEHSRNGDYLPTRLDAQKDAVNLIFSAKTQANPESSVGLMSMGGSQPEVLTTLTTDQGKIINGLYRTKERGSPHFSTALNVASLALKHRLNKSQHPRVIMFTCSPLAESEKQITALAKRLKKNGIAVDVVCFGDMESDTVKKAEVFHEAIKSSNESADDQSHLAVIPPGPNLLSDSILASPIISGDSAGMGGPGMNGASGESGGDSGFDMGFDPNNDPELALALRMSMEDEERRQQREREERERAQQPQLEPVAEDQEDNKADGAGNSSEKGPEQGGAGGSGDNMDTS